jgi:hypothetical protein
MRPRLLIGDSVEVTYPDGRRRVGMVQSLEYDVVRLLVGGAEGQGSIMTSIEKLRPVGPNLWHVEAD